MTDTSRHYDYFISYSHEDRRFAVKLQKRLEAAGKGVCRDETVLPPGVNWDTEIRARLKDTPIILLILSPSSVKSPFVSAEVRVARDAGRKIFPIVHKESDRPLWSMEDQEIDLRYRPIKDGIEAILNVAPLPPPRWYTSVLRKTGTVTPIALLLPFLLLITAYHLRSSKTFATLSDIRDSKTISVLLENRGGQPSSVVGPYELKFGTLPVVDTTLERADKQGNVVPKNGRLEILLTKEAGFTPRLSDGTYLTAKQIGELTPKRAVLLEIGIEESNQSGSTPRLISIPAVAIRRFLEQRLPTIVKGGTTAN